MNNKIRDYVEFCIIKSWEDLSKEEKKAYLDSKSIYLFMLFFFNHIKMKIGTK